MAIIVCMLILTVFISWYPIVLDTRAGAFGSHLSGPMIPPQSMCFDKEWYIHG